MVYTSIHKDSDEGLVLTDYKFECLKSRLVEIIHFKSYIVWGVSKSTVMSSNYISDNFRWNRIHLQVVHQEY